MAWSSSGAARRASSNPNPNPNPNSDSFPNPTSPPPSPWAHDFASSYSSSSSASASWSPTATATAAASASASASASAHPYAYAHAAHAAQAFVLSPSASASAPTPSSYSRPATSKSRSTPTPKPKPRPNPSTATDPVPSPTVPFPSLAPAAAAAPAPVPAPDDFFLDRPSSSDSDMSDHYPPRRNDRDSHDLSLGPRNVTRDSLVNNMLMSLDQFSLGYQQPPSSSYQPNHNSYEPTASSSSRLYQDHHSIPTHNSPHHNHNLSIDSWPADSPADADAGPDPGHQYSYSSDLDAPDDSGRMSSQASRGRRSNSSSNFQAGFARLNSVREALQRNPPSTPRGMHSRSRKGSKSSSSASIDAGYSQAMGHRWGRGVNRSASFDNSPHRPPLYPPTLPHSSSTFHVNSSSHDFLHDDYEAAPTPTIPNGPRRIPSENPIAAQPPRIPPEPTQSPFQGRERTRSITRSIRSSAGRKPMTSHEPAPAVPALDLEDSAPAPNVSYNKSKEPKPSPAPAADSSTQTKERTGFFRRVFGGGASKNAPVTNDSSSASRQTSQAAAVSSAAAAAANNGNTSSEQASRKAQSASQSRSGSTPPSRDVSSSHSNHPALQKKTSFFRRRKRSVHEEVPPLPTSIHAPPVPPIAPIDTQSDNDWAIPKAPPSPVSSLREALNPYLRDSPAHVAQSRAHAGLPLNDITNTGTPNKMGYESDREAFKREFSPDYAPSPNARIRAVEAEPDDDFIQQSTPSKPASGRSAPANEPKNDTFLNLDGASDNEELVVVAKQKPSHSARSPSLTLDTSMGGFNRDKNKEKNKDDTIRASTRHRIRIDPPDSDDEQGRSNLALPIEGARAASPTSASTATDYKSAASGPPSVRIEPATENSPKMSAKESKSLDEPDYVLGEPTEDDQQKAQKIFDGQEDFIQKDKAASWMGEEGPVRQRTLQAYMALYDFTNQSIVQALRQVCGRLVLRAETQQVDRILVAFSKRWCDCNPNHGFEASDVIHTICYSIMLLNTDLHVADIDQKMTRSQFVKNTMTTIVQALDEAVPNAFTRPTILSDKASAAGNEQVSASPAPVSAASDRRTFRNSFLPPARQDSDLDDCGPLVKAPFHGTRRAWEDQIELVLKGIYSSIRDERLPLFGADPEKLQSPETPQSSLSVMGMLKRTPSVLSKAPSESQLSSRGRIADNSRTATARWASKSRSRPGIGRTAFSSSHTSFDDENSLWSPALSSATWSRYSLGRTQTSISQDSLASAMARDYQKSIGFANALSQAIIRDEDASAIDTAGSVLSTELVGTQLLEDESLELAGPPWIKEGIVIHKHHLDGVDKKAKERNWTEVFAVVQKGQMNLFSFNANKSLRQKSRSRHAARENAPVGGGNWQNNATSVGTFNLRQTLASVLPSPGYSRTRPHVWALSLPTGAVHLFQVGTPEIIKEFVTTVNYWSARLSTHPLVGGISNIEYGWSDAIVNNALVAAINDSTAQTASSRASRPGSSAATGRRSSVQSGSLRSFSFDHGPGGFTNNSGRGKLPGDRVHIAEWTSPTQSLRASTLSEAEQLTMLSNYVKGIEEDLQTHNRLRSPMLLAFTPRGSNAIKAMSNWERKSAYLLRESVKYRTYVDCLQQAESRKQEVYKERDLARRAARGELSEGEIEASDVEDADQTLRP
ncbi:hypothetical protein B0I35DRAFT_407278 [Stachybotrys elegans]|uniref:SEC7 domain-containing protein n=1 Tax=Stachybotrys elegans TaxID=80388 RepID=A0A8K0SVQ8_9HYPO|nr:hypothetical protein B0I35DRAFT_407278 [Stachybotrys elegans]